MNTLDKKMVVDSLISLFEEKIQKLTRSLEDIRERARDAPGSNVSHSDTSKSQLSDLAHSLEKQFEEPKEVLNFLKNLKVMDRESVVVGALFTLADKSGGYNHYFLLPCGGGDLVAVNDEEVMAVSVASPLVGAVKGKKRGDEINFRSSALVVKNVW